MAKTLIIMGSPADKDWCKKISDELRKFNIVSEMRVASAHKVPEQTLNIIRTSEYDVIITVAGRSNALSGFADGSTCKPVIACPPLDGQTILLDLYSSIRMPSGIAPMLVLTPENAALAAAKIIGLKDEEVRKKVEEYQKTQQKKLLEADAEVRNG